MKKFLAPVLMTALMGVSITPLPVLAQSGLAANLGNQAVYLDEQISVPGGQKKISISVTDENVRNVLRELSQKGGFNLVMDESVSGDVTIELTNVPINQALQSVAAMADIQLLRQNGGIYLAISRQTAQEKGISRQLSKVINIYYTSAVRVADLLNRSIFASANSTSATSGGASQAIQKAKADARTNSVIVVGTAREIELAEAAVARLDMPRQSKTFYLSHANALDVATMLASSVFNDGTTAFSLNGAGTSASTTTTSSTGGTPAMPSTLRVEKQDVQEGTGINSFGGSSSSGSGGGTSSGFSSQVTLRGFVKSTDKANVSPEGALVIPDTRQNAITILGTAEQIAMAESMIPTLDAQLPQVSIEASLIEVTEDGVKELSTHLGLGQGRIQSGFNNVALSGVKSVGGLSTTVQPSGTGLIGIPTVDSTEPEAFARSGLLFSTSPLTTNKDVAFQIRSLMTSNKAKILANPTVVATHDTESIISIVDEVVRRVTTQLDPSGFATQTVEVGEAGIVMDILPKIGEDQTISMRLRPSVTTVREETRDALGNLITLLSKRDLLTQNVRVRNGETLVIGGLIQQNDTIRKDKMPVAGDLPIVGAMFRASQGNNHRSELMLLITPHIINPTRATPVNTSALPTSDPMGGAQ